MRSGTACVAEMIIALNFSHRTPLNIVSTGLYFVETKLRDGNDINGILDAIADTKTAADIAIELLSDFLNYEKLNSNQMTLDISPINLSKLVQDKLRPMQLLASKRNVNLTFCCDDMVNDGIAYVDADASKIAVVLRNFVSNAIKFSPEGGSVFVTKRVIHDEIETKDEERDFSSYLFDRSAIRWLQSSIAPEPPKQLVVRISIKDTGFGISLENQKKVFNEVVQFHANAHQQGGGSGLGLWISKRIIDLHRGKVGLLSEGEGFGSTFYFDIPVSKVVNEVPPPIDRKATPLSPLLVVHKRTSESLDLQPAYRRLIILVVDDSSLNRRMVTRMFEALGHRCREADDGDTAIEMVEESLQNGVYFDAVVIDDIMSRLNGSVAIKQIRKLGYKNMVFGLTGNAASDDVQTFLNCGVDKVLIKPLTRGDISEMISWIYSWDLMLNGDV